jgi:membrane protease YdiL (CAAX protease family)
MWLGPHIYVPSTELTGFPGFLEKVKPVLPIPLLAILLTLLWRVFRETWRELDEDAHRFRQAAIDTGAKYDTRPLIALVMCATILAMQEYFGGRTYFDMTLRPLLQEWAQKRIDAGKGVDPLGLVKYSELWGYVWWAGTRIFGYVLVPFPLWKLLYPADSLLDMGLRVTGFFRHIWIYALFLLAVLPAMYVVSKQPDFGNYYPFYKLSERSWGDFLLWEAMYFAQFFALELFFRGFWLHALRRSFGSGAIFAMAVPYCMIHFGKPYLEAVGAIIAGIALGSLSMKTKSIYQGFLVHITVAGLMDILSLSQRHALPHVWWGAN